MQQTHLAQQLRETVRPLFYIVLGSSQKKCQAILVVLKQPPSAACAPHRGLSILASRSKSSIGGESLYDLDCGSFGAAYTESKKGAQSKRNGEDRLSDDVSLILRLTIVGIVRYRQDSSHVGENHPSGAVLYMKMRLYLTSSLLA